MPGRVVQRTRKGQPVRPGIRTIATAMLLPALAAAVAADPLFPTFDTRTASGFGDPVPALREYLSREPSRPPGVQHICIVGYIGADGDRSAQVHWREGHRLILWDGSDPEHSASVLGWGRRDLDLTADVVATDAEQGSSTYLVTRAWVARVLADCAAHGVRYAVAMGPRRPQH